jgi:hypothetical protein
MSMARILAGYGFNVTHTPEASPPPSPTTALRERACTLATAAGLPLAVVDTAMTEAHTWQDCPDEVIAAYLRALHERGERIAGRIPPGWTLPGHCAGCGPVWLSPDSIHTALSCPWCWNRIDGLPIPRPPSDAA